MALNQTASCKCGCGLPTSGAIIRNKNTGRYGQVTEYAKGHFGRRYTFDRRLFSEVETQDDAYWLGFFAADGFVKSKGTFGFHLGIPDLDHLRRFAEYAGSNQPIIVKEKWCRLEISDKHHLPVLEKWGFVQGKSRTATIPPLPDGMVRHFIRGVFDGDGTVTRKRYGQSKAYIHIIGSETMMMAIREEFARALDAPMVTLNRRATSADWVARIAYAGSETTERMFSYFYDGATTYLERKYDKWQQLRQP